MCALRAELRELRAADVAVAVAGHLRGAWRGCSSGVNMAARKTSDGLPPLSVR